MHGAEARPAARGQMSSTAKVGTAFLGGPQIEGDLIVIGGGIHGLMIALFAAESGLQTILIERGQLGSGTTAAWFRILHGGLRYLQQLDVTRLRRSARERNWFLRNFPELVTTVPFLMPLYGGGLKRPGAFRVALAAEAMLTADLRRPGGIRDAMSQKKVLIAAAAARITPALPQEGMLGAALWPEAVVPDGERLIRAVAARAGRAGATLIEGLEVRDFVVDRGKVAGVLAAPPGDARVQRFIAPVVINATGPSAGELAARADPSGRFAFHPVMGFNLRIAIPPPAEVALAVTPRGGGAMLFVQPDRGMTFAGTWYAPAGGRGADMPDDQTIDAFLAAIRSALPGFAPTRRDVAEVTVGFLPGTGRSGTALMRRDVVHDHGAAGGPPGLFSVAGIKYTTAGAVAREVLTCVRRSGVVGAPEVSAS
jgi:glycerol-3-phosphate dehydrogenase